MKEFAQAILSNEDDNLTCAECDALLPEWVFAELAAGGADSEDAELVQQFAVVRRHLSACPRCSEEYTQLKQMLEATYAPAEAAAQQPLAAAVEDERLLAPASGRVAEGEQIRHPRPVRWARFSGFDCLKGLWQGGFPSSLGWAIASAGVIVLLFAVQVFTTGRLDELVNSHLAQLPLTLPELVDAPGSTETLDVVTPRRTEAALDAGFAITMFQRSAMYALAPYIINRPTETVALAAAQVYTFNMLPSGEEVLVRSFSTPTSLPGSSSPLDQPFVVTVTVPSGAVLRSEPSRNGYAVTLAASGEQFVALGRSLRGDWISVRLIDGSVAWIDSSMVSPLAEDVFSLPVVVTADWFEPDSTDADSKAGPPP